MLECEIPALQGSNFTIASIFPVILSKSPRDIFLSLPGLLSHRPLVGRACRVRGQMEAL